MKDMRVKTLAQGAVIAALYVVLTQIFAPISFREIQVRVSEALTVLPFFTFSAVPGLFVGCLLANMLGGAIPLDVICGSLATLAGAIGTYYTGKAARRTMAGKLRFLAPVPPIAANTIVVPLVLYYGYGVNLPIWMQMLTVGLGEVIGCGVFGTVLLLALEKRGVRLLTT